MNKSMLKITAFAVAIIGFYIYITVYVAGLSGTGGGESAGGVNPEAGEKVFWGTVSAAPVIKSVPVAAHREVLTRTVCRRGQKNVRKELGMPTGLDYLVESMVEPEKYIVKGYDKIMPKVYDPPIMLSREKILAVIAYLQSLGGEPDIGAIMKYKDKIPEASKKKVKPWVPPIVVDAKEGEKVFFDETRTVTCGKCHIVNGKGKKVGPELTGIGAIQTAEYFWSRFLSQAQRL